MPVYELVCIATHIPTTNASLLELVQGISKKVLDRGGVVRDVRNLGTRTLPTRMRRHQQYYNEGDYFSILFDTSPPVLKELDVQLAADPSVIRWTMLRKGNTIKDLLPKREFTMQFTPEAKVGED